MSAEFTAKVKTFLESRGAQVNTEVEGLTVEEIKQYAEIAQLYFGIVPATSLMGLAYPESLPADLQEAIEGGEEPPEEGGDEDEPEEPSTEGASVQSFSAPLTPPVAEEEPEEEEKEDPVEGDSEQEPEEEEEPGSEDPEQE